MSVDEEHRAPKRIGRPPTYSDALALEICEHIASGKSLISWVREHGARWNITYGAVVNWLAKRPAFDEMYARAREDSADADADAMSDLRDRVLTGELDPQAARVAMDALKWTAGKRKPKRYGDNVQLRHSDADGEKLNTQPLVSELLTMLGPGATLQAAVKIEAPTVKEPLASAFGVPLIPQRSEALTQALDAEADVMLARSEAKVARRAAARAEAKESYRPRSMARPTSDADDLV